MGEFEHLILGQELQERFQYSKQSQGMLPGQEALEKGPSS
jgi:hypothetical protein